MKNLEEETGSVVVGQIGRTVIVYRPSITKLKAEEKKKQAARVFMRKQSRFRPASSARNPEVIPVFLSYLVDCFFFLKRVFSN